MGKLRLKFKKFSEKLLNLLYPKGLTCNFCGKELDDEGWHRMFEPTTGVRTITSEMDEITITPGTQSVIKPQMLTVSTFTRMYPEFCTEYWFGILQQNDLTQTVSQIQTAVNNG